MECDRSNRTDRALAAHTCWEVRREHPRCVSAQVLLKSVEERSNPPPNGATLACTEQAIHDDGRHGLARGRLWEGWLELGRPDDVDLLGHVQMPR